MNTQLESIILIESRTKYSSPHGKDNPETFAYQAGATAYAGHCIGFAEWCNDIYIKCHGGWMLRYQSQIKATVYTTEQLFIEYLKQKEGK